MRLHNPKIRVPEHRQGGVLGGEREDGAQLDRVGVVPREAAAARPQRPLVQHVALLQRLRRVHLGSLSTSVAS